MANAKLRRYELVFLIQPDAEEEARKNLVARMLGILEEGGAHLIQKEEWGKRKLSYEIEKFNKAYYYYVEFISSPGLSHEIERIFRLTDDCVRYQTIRLEDEIDPDDLDRFAIISGDGEEEVVDEPAAEAAADEPAAEAAAEEPAAEAAAEEPAAEVAAEEPAAEAAAVEAAPAVEAAAEPTGETVEETSEETSEEKASDEEVVS
jgi:small subunit ribosomal protein S6